MIIFYYYLCFSFSSPFSRIMAEFGFPLSKVSKAEEENLFKNLAEALAEHNKIMEEAAAQNPLPIEIPWLPLPLESPWDSQHPGDPWERLGDPIAPAPPKIKRERPTGAKLDAVRKKWRINSTFSKRQVDMRSKSQTELRDAVKKLQNELEQLEDDLDDLHCDADISKIIASISQPMKTSISSLRRNRNLHALSQEDKGPVIKKVLATLVEEMTAILHKDT